MRRVVWLLLATLVATPAVAQQAGTAMQSAPAAMEAESPPDPPMAVRQSDTERFAPPPPAPAPAAAPPVAGPGSRTVTVGEDAPPPENGTCRSLIFAEWTSISIAMCSVP